ncbi:MAG: HAMP domain-containing histidine kinase [Bacilli bacterium]|nr:HAMP domain-containing histidine kinase [Bacilli bacterium]
MKEEKGGVLLRDREFHQFTHELKNPLAICNGYLEIMLQKKSINSSYLPIIKSEVQRSLDIISLYSNRKFFTLEMEEFDLVYLLEDVIETLKLLFLESQSKILFLETREYYMLGDYNRLKQVFFNLLKNAYEARGENHLLVVVRIVEFPDYYQIQITDNGIGMTAKELRRIGEEYYTTKEEGTGLGISYCKEVVRRHGGDLFYQSRKSLGTRVLLTLPKRKKS